MVTPQQLVITRCLILVCLLVSPASTYAETKVLTAEATYTMGDGESPSFAEAMVLQKAKQMALEQAGTYVESYTKVQNYQLTTEEIQTIAGGVMEVEVLEKTRTLVADGLRFSIKIKATVTTDKVTELAQRIKGKNIAEEYKKLQEEYARLSKEIEKWKQLIAKTPTGPEREEALDQIHEREKAFASVRKLEDDLFLRLVSGEALARQALDQQVEMDRLIQTIVQQGHKIDVGEPKASPISGKRDYLKFRIPITVTASQQILPLLSDITDKLGGTVHAKEIYPLDFHPNPRREPVTLVHITSDPEAEKYFLEELSKSSLLVELYLSGGQTKHCKPINVLIDKNRHQRILAAQWDKTFDGREYPRDWRGLYFRGLEFLIIIDGATTFAIEMLIPKKIAQNITRISARFTLQEDSPKELEKTDFQCVLVR